MPEMVGGCPISEFHLCNELRSYPSIVFHRLRCQSFPPPGRLRLRKIVERTGFCFELSQMLEDLLLQTRGKAVLDFGDEDEPVSIVVIPDCKIVKTVRSDSIAANDQLLAFVH